MEWFNKWELTVNTNKRCLLKVGVNDVNEYILHMLMALNVIQCNSIKNKSSFIQK